MRRFAFSKLAVFCAALALAACDAPPVSSELTGEASSHIDGRVVVSGHVRGNVLVFLFDAAHPPPPEGTGRPVSFTVVPSATIFGDAAKDPSGTGPFVAPFSLSLVPPGKYLLEGFVDHDGCAPPSSGCHGPDFVPWYAVTDEPNAGDVGGAALAPGTSTPAVITVDGTQSVEGVAVTYADAAAYPLNRPAFAVKGDGTFDPSQGEKTLELDATRIDSGGVYETNPAFLVQSLDESGDGTADTLFPKVLVRKLEDGQPGTVILEASVVPPASLVDGSGALVVGTAQAPSLTVKIEPVALDVSDPSNPKPLPSVPSGAYQVLLVSGTGQTWQLPNELAPASAPALGLPSIESQGFTLQVP